MATSEQLEREAEATRAQISATLDELRGRMTPGQVLDQLVDYARDSGGGEFVRNFGRQVAGNPIPVTLVGAGLAWLMMAGRGGPGRRDGGTGVAGTDDVAEGMSEAGRARGTPDAAGVQAGAKVANLSDHAVRRAQEWSRQTRATAERLGERVGDAGTDLQETMSAAGANVRDAASTAYDAASAAYDTATERSRQGADALGRNARAMGDKLAATGQGFWSLLQEQPLVLAGLGLAIGGLLGASLPSSEAEDRLMGDVSDAAKREAKAFAQEQVDKGRHVAEQAWDAAKPEMDKQFDRTTSGTGGGSPGDTSHQAATGFGGEAPLVPSDQAAQAEAVGNGDRGDTEHRSR
jgi:hypothetical protein